MSSGRRALVSAVDYHTAGEPFRIVTGGAPLAQGDTVAERRVDATTRLDATRRLVVLEPRGHSGMYGCFLTPPDDGGAVLGALFFHQSGFSTACGHGTIALATWAADAGLVAPDERSFFLDVPSGRVGVDLERRADGSVVSVGFRNVPAFVHERDVPVATSHGGVAADVAFGGAFYACLAANAVGLRVDRADLAGLIALGREVQRELDARAVATHPSDGRLNGIYGVIFTEDLGQDGDGGLLQRNVTVFGDGQIDRSPCGSGTSARLALLDGDGLPRGHDLVHESIVGTRFRARVIESTIAEGRQAVLTEVRGRASLTGTHQFVLDPHDEVGEGFRLS